MTNENLLDLTVKDYLFGECSEGVLSDRASNSEYWEKVQDFIDGAGELTLRALSQNQLNWVFKIKEGLLE